MEMDSSFIKSLCKKNSSILMNKQQKSVYMQCTSPMELGTNYTAIIQV